MYLVTGATGNVGSELVTILAGAGQPVRTLVRNARPAGPSDVDAGGVAFLIFAVVYLAIAAATGGPTAAQWTTAVVGGALLGAVAVGIAILIVRRRAGR